MAQALHPGGAQTQAQFDRRVRLPQFEPQSLGLAAAAVGGFVEPVSARFGGDEGRLRALRLFSRDRVFSRSQTFCALARALAHAGLTAGGAAGGQPRAAPAREGATTSKLATPRTGPRCRRCGCRRWRRRRWPAAARGRPRRSLRSRADRVFEAGLGRAPGRPRALRDRPVGGAFEDDDAVASLSSRRARCRRRDGDRADPVHRDAVDALPAVPFCIGSERPVLLTHPAVPGFWVSFPEVGIAVEDEDRVAPFRGDVGGCQWMRSPPRCRQCADATASVESMSRATTARGT